MTWHGTAWHGIVKANVLSQAYRAMAAGVACFFSAKSYYDGTGVMEALSSGLNGVFPHQLINLHG